MATKGRPSNPDVSVSKAEVELRKEPFLFEFFQAVRLLERLFPDKSPVGRFHPPSAEVVRFIANSTLAFPASEVQSLEWPNDSAGRMKVNFMGLTGPEGVMPLYYTSLLAERARAGDRSAVDFFDIFNHRMISLFYLAWEKYRFSIAYEREGLDPFSHHLMDLIGLGTPGLQNRLPVLDDSLLYYAGLLAQHPRSAEALRNLLRDYFEVPVEVEQFAGGWYPLDRNTQTALQDGFSESEQLGFGAVVGDEVWDQTARVRIGIGPLSLQEYQDFLPQGSAFESLRALTDFFSNGEIDFEIKLILERSDVPPLELGAEGEDAPQLGWHTYIKTRPMKQDASETILQLWERSAYDHQPKITDRKTQ
ncbi:MAG: type VI secretion system baseplate subunit TssG [Acidobacteriota bacterium]|nr:type VI secretion system baseplate subunit TssG [Acidobacteriota bacterium]